MNMDTQRGRLYGLTWPSGYFLRYDLKSGELKNLGPLYRDGENGRWTRRVLCRALPIDPADGSVYFTNADGDILRYRYDRDAIETVQGDNLRKDYFGTWNPLVGQDMGYGWRQAVWYAPENAIYAIHGRSGYLFRFDPRAERVDVLRRIASEPSLRSGMYDDFHFGYLSFTLGPDGHTLYYLTEGGIVENGKRVVVYETPPGAPPGTPAELVEDLHLITYDIPAAKYIDHGAVFFSDGGRPGLVNSIAVGKDGSTYCITDIPGRVGGTLTWSAFLRWSRQRRFCNSAGNLVPRRGKISLAVGETYGKEPREKGSDPGGVEPFDPFRVGRIACRLEP